MEKKYAVKWGYGHYSTNEFQEIGNWDRVLKWIEDGSLKGGDEIYELKAIVETKTVISIKYNEDDN